MEDDEEKIVILISGCSSGIGAAAAEAFAKETPKYRVWASMRNTTQWKGDKFENLELIEMDVKDTESVENAVNHVINCEGKIDVIINNAGYGIAGFLETVSIAEAQKLFDTNVWGPVRVLQAVLPHMRSRRKGYVINTSSTSGIRGVPCMDYYTGTVYFSVSTMTLMNDESPN
jgi:NADP-dependent 3-hydroxy acid dehydrogenase YdfG